MQNLINFKILVLGSQGVGKTCLILRYLQGLFDENYNVTVGVQFASKTLHIQEDSYVRLQIWDTAGQELFRALVKSFYKGISAVFLVYSIDKANSLKQLKTWANQVRQNSHKEVVMFLVGAKSDYDQDRKVSSKDAQNFLIEIQGAFYVQTSAKTGQNIQFLFKKVADYLYKKFQGSHQFRELVQPSKTSILGDSLKQGSKSTSVPLKKSSIYQSYRDKNKNNCCG